MEIALRAALLDWLRRDETLAASLNAVTEEAPSRSALPWLALTASASTEWGCKTMPGREVRVIFELHARADAPDALAALSSAIENRVLALPRQQSGFRVVSARFLRSRAEQRPDNRRAVLGEYAFRLLAA